MEKENKKRQIINLVADPYPPYQYAENDSIKGIDNDIIIAAFKENNILTKIQLLPWEDCINQIKMKKADGIFQIVRTLERKKILLFSKPLRTAKAVFLRKVGTQAEVCKDTNLKAQFKNYKIGVLAGYSYDAEIDSLREPIKKDFKIQEMLLIELSEGKLDLAILDLGVATYLMNTMNISDVEKVSGYEIKRQLYVAFQKGYDELLSLFNSGLDTIKKKGIYNKIIQEY